jgi:hypothetical protein
VGAESGENYIMRSLMICTLHRIFFGDQIKKNEIGGAGSTYAGEYSCAQDFGEET